MSSIVHYALRILWTDHVFPRLSFPSPEGTYIYHLKPKATPLILLVIGLWVWMWGVFLGIGRVTIAGVVGEWYFHRDDPALPNATTANLKQTDPFGLGFEIETTRIAFNRATGPSLGSICLSALIMAVLRTVRQAAHSLKKVCPFPLSGTYPSP